MADEQTIQIDLELDPAGEVAVVDVPEVKTAPEAAATTDGPIQTLKKQYDELKAKDETRAKALEASQRSEAEARAKADQSAREVVQARTIAANNSFQSVEHAIAAIDSEISVAKRDFAAAMDQADYTKAADAQDKIASFNSRKAIAERDKYDIDQQRKRQEVVLDRPAPRPQVQDPLSGLTQPSRVWLEAHPECLNDEERYLSMMAADKGARKAGIAPDTPEYFSFVERRLGYAGEEQSTIQPRPRAMPAAPPSRDASSTPGGKVSVKLTSGEVKNAEDGTIIWNSGPNKGKPIGTHEMARRKAIDTAAGKYRNINVN